MTKTLLAAAPQARVIAEAGKPSVQADSEIRSPLGAINSAELFRGKLTVVAEGSVLTIKAHAEIRSTLGFPHPGGLFGGKLIVVAK
jgi:hypothetical protein